LPIARPTGSNPSSSARGIGRRSNVSDNGIILSSVNEDGFLQAFVIRNNWGNDYISSSVS
jgi:hypothetical protein